MPTFCDYYDRQECRSCSWLERSYPEQLREKEALVRQSLGTLNDSGKPCFQLLPTVGSAEQGFRNRAKMTVTGSIHRPLIGLTGSADLDQGRELLHCPIHHPRLNELIAALPAWISHQRIEPYRIQARQGELKGLIAFYSPDSLEMYLRFVVRSEAAVPAIREGIADLQRVFPDLVCVSANLQPIPHAILEGPEEIFLTERRSIQHRLGALALRLSPQAFVQTNVAVATRLYETAAHWIAQNPVDPASAAGQSRGVRLMELYCGQGAFSFFAAPHVGEALGIEIHAGAVETAQQTARELGLTHLTFKAADATQVGLEIQEFAPTCILVNPPRRGLGPSGVAHLLQSGADRILYSSCSLDSLTRDARELARTFRITRTQIFDLFPHTDHFETLVEFVRTP